MNDKINNADLIIHSKHVVKSKHPEQDMMQAMHEVLQNKAVYNALKKLADE